MRKIVGRSGKKDERGRSALSDKSGRRTSERQSEGVKLLPQGKILFQMIKLKYHEICLKRD